MPRCTQKFLLSINANYQNYGSESQQPAVFDDQAIFWFAANVNWQKLPVVDEVHTLQHLAEDHVLPIQPRRRLGGYEELRSVRVWACPRFMPSQC